MKVGPQTLRKTEKLVINQNIPHDPFGNMIKLEEEEEAAREFFHKENVLWCRARGPHTHL